MTVKCAWNCREKEKKIRFRKKSFNLALCTQCLFPKKVQNIGLEYSVFWYKWRRKMLFSFYWIILLSLSPDSLCTWSLLRKARFDQKNWYPVSKESLILNSTNECSSDFSKHLFLKCASVLNNLKKNTSSFAIKKPVWLCRRIKSRIRKIQTFDPNNN